MIFVNSKAINCHISNNKYKDKSKSIIVKIFEAIETIYKHILIL